MRAIETIAEILPDGTLTAQLPGIGPESRRRVVIVTAHGAGSVVKDRLRIVGPFQPGADER